MTAEPPQSPATEGVCSLEVRWIFPGQPGHVAGAARARGCIAQQIPPR